MNIRNIALYLFLFAFCITGLLTACRPAKKVQRIGNVITTRDTSKTDAKTNVVDSASIVKEAVNRLTAQRINFSTFSAKVKMDYDGSAGNGQATVYLRMKKDSLIWMSLTGALGIEGFRVMITPDSVKIMNKLEKVIQYRPISYLKELTQVPVDFHNLEDILIGNPVYLDSNLLSYQITNNNLLILMAGKTFKNLLTIDKDNLHVIHSKLDDVNPNRNRTADITYDDYNKIDNFSFSSSRKISVAEKSKLDVQLEFKQYDFNKPETFPFNIPKNYKIK